MKINLRLENLKQYKKVSCPERMLEGREDNILVLRDSTQVKLSPIDWIDPNKRLTHIYDAIGKSMVEVPSLTLKCIKNAKVNSSGIILNRYNELVSESTIVWNSVESKDGYVSFDLEKNKAIPNLKQCLTNLTVSRCIPEPSILFLALNSSHYSHWLYEAFARSCLFDLINFPKLTDLKCVVHDLPSIYKNNASHQRYFFYLMGIDTQNLEYISNGEWLFFDYLFVPSRVVDLEANRYFVMPESIKFLNSLVDKVDSLSSPYGKLVYISRSEATTRIVKNEEDIESKLAKLGFDTVFPGTLNTQDKISTFANAEIVIGPVGNGIIGTPFMRQNSEVVLLTTTFLHRTLNYHTMFCSMNNNPCHIVVESDKVIASGKSHYDNLGYFSIIDVDTLCEAIRQIMYQKGITPNHISAKKITSLTYPKGSREYIKQMEKHKLMSSLDLDAPGYKEYLRRFHQKLQPNAYLEIGVETGASLILSNPNTICIGVDPSPNIKVSLPKNIKLFEMISDVFFESINVISEFKNNQVDLAFLDGLHEFDQTLKDFINTEKYSHKSGHILLHDVLPLNRITSLRERKTAFWSGDVYKVILILKKYRPELEIKVIATPPTGLGVITNLNPESTTLTDNFTTIVKEYMQLDYDDLLGRNKWESLNVVKISVNNVEKRF